MREQREKEEQLRIQREEEEKYALLYYGKFGFFLTKLH